MLPYLQVLIEKKKQEKHSGGIVHNWYFSWYIRKDIERGAKFEIHFVN